MTPHGVEIDQPAVLTRGTLLAAIEKVRNAPMRVCGVTEPHVVHPRASGWTGCANCFGPVFVCIGESGCDGVSHDIRCNNLRYRPLSNPPAGDDR